MEHHQTHEHAHTHDHSAGPIDISRHEGALIGAIRGRIPGMDYDTAEKALIAQTEAAARRVGEAGGIIGHIKFLLCAEGRCGQISVTDADAEPSIRHFDGGGCRVEGVAIVFALEEDELRHILEDSVASLISPEA